MAFLNPSDEGYIVHYEDAEADKSAALSEKDEEITQLRGQLAEEEAEHLETIGRRDELEEIADKLSGAIAIRFRVDVGEHSSANCPWTNALEILAQPSEHEATGEGK